MRRWIAASLLCAACTRDNPAFDAQMSADASTDGEGEGDGDGDGDDNGDGDGDTSTTTGMPDLGPEPALCEYPVRSGLAIHVGTPENFGGVCPGGVNTGARILRAGGGEIVVESCAHGCQTCYDSKLTISAFPLLIDDHLPLEQGKCVSIEAQGSLGEEPACPFGALTIYEGQVPYVIATAHSYEPTTVGLSMLGNLIPAPMKAGDCSCDEVGQSNDCCYMAEGLPEFWYYPFEAKQVFPGDSVEVAIQNADNLTHVFEPFQAQQLHSCESPDLQLSWAVVAEL